MDVEEIQPDEDENSHLSIGIMSDIHEDDADKYMNSEEEQQLNDSSNSLDQRTDNPLLSNEVNEIDNTIGTSQLPSSTIMGLNCEGFENEDTMNLNQKEPESNRDEKFGMEDIQMESSNMSLKLDDENTYMSTDMKEGIGSLSSDVSMSSEREMHSPVIDSEMSVVGLSNLNKKVSFISTEKVDNLILDGKISDGELHDSGASQTEENIEVSQMERSTILNDADTGLNNLNKEVKFMDTSKLDNNLFLDCKSSDVKLYDSTVSQIEEKIKVNQMENSNTRIEADIGLNNLNKVARINTKKLDTDNLMLNCKNSDVELHDSGVSQIEGKIEVSHIEKSTTFDDALQQEKNYSSASEHGDRSSILKENFTENIYTCENSKDPDVSVSQNLEVSEEIHGNVVEKTGLDLLSTEKQFSQDQGLCELNIKNSNYDEKLCYNATENDESTSHLNDVSEIITDAILTNKDDLKENSELLSKREEQSSCDNDNLQEKEQIYLKEESEIKSSKSSESNKSQKEICSKKNIPAGENPTVYEKFEIQEEESNIGTFVLSSNENISNGSKMIDISGNMNFSVKPVVEDESFNSDKISSIIQINGNQTSKGGLLAGLNNDNLGSLPNLGPIVAIQKLDDNFNNQKDSVQESEIMNICNEHDDILQRHGDDSRSEIEHNVKPLNESSHNLSDESVKHSMEEEVNKSNHSEDFTEEVKVTVEDEDKKNTTVLNECSDILTEKSKGIMMDNEMKIKKSCDVNEEVKSDSKNLDECLDDLSIETKETIIEKGAEIDLNILQKHANFTKSIEDMMDEETKNGINVSDECSSNIMGVEKAIVLREQIKTSEILNKNLDSIIEESKEINKDTKILIEFSDFTERKKVNVVKEETINMNVTEDETTSKSQFNSLESKLQKCFENKQRKKTDIHSDTDSNSNENISDYLINLNKKDYITTPDLISEDSVSNMYEENNDKEEKISDAKSPTEAELKLLENKRSLEEGTKNEITQSPPVKHDNIDETIEIERKSGTIDASDNSDSIELTSENENYFEVVDEITEEDTKKTERKPITTEGLAKSFSKSKFNEEPGKEIKDGFFTRVVIVGDSFISSFSKMWPKNSKIKPYFLYKDDITLNQILRFKIQNHAYLKNSEKIFVLFICGLHELSLYSTYKFHGCHGIHLPFKYIRKIENDSRTVNRYLKEMTTLKEKLENGNGVFVAFSYLPEIDIGYISHALSELSHSKNFGCSCNFPLGTSSSVESINSISNINRNIFYRNLNETKLGIFEYSPVNITFYFEYWCMYSKKRKLKENSDVFTLSHLLSKYVYEEAVVKSNVNNGDSGVCSPVTLHTTVSDTGRTLIIGDMWIKYVAENWNMKLDIKPFFYCKNGLTFNCIRKVITSVERTGDRLLIISAIPSGEFLTISKFSECKDHSPLEYPVPNMRLLKDPLAYAEYVIKKLDLLSVHACERSKIVFLTCYPAFFKNYYKSLYEKHIKNNSSHGNSKSLEDMHDCSDFETKLEHCFKKINKHAASLNKELGIPTCNVFSLMHKLSANDRPVFPTEAKAVSESLQKKLLQLFEKYVCSLYNENIFGGNYKSKIDEKNSTKETITDVILKNAEIKVKIENKSVDENTKPNSAEPSEKSRIVVFKEKKKSSTISDKNLAHSSGVKSKREGAKKSFIKLEGKKDEPDEDDSHHPKSSFSDFRRHDSSSSYHHYNEEYSYQYDYLVSSPSRYESRSKYSRDFPLRGRKRSYTRSRSKDRRSNRSRSKDRYSRGINKDRRYIRSRSKDRTFYRNRSRDRKRSRSKSQNRNKRHSRSRSRSSSRKRPRNSRSPYRKHHKSKHNSTKSDRSYRSKSRSKSKNRSSGKLELSREISALEKNAVANLWEAHSREREMYRKHPENHPDHDRVKRMWLNIMSSQGLNTFDQSILQFWWEYWPKKMEELIEESWEEKKLKCLAILSSKRKASKSPASSNSNSSDADSEYERHSKKKKTSKSKKAKRKKKSRKISPSRSKDKEKLLISDNVPTSVDEMEGLLQEFVRKNSKSFEETSSKRYPVEKKVTKFNTSKGSEEMLDVFSILCQISDKFGALGMSLTVLHQKAVECVKNDLSPYNCIDEDAKMLLDLISDKIKKMLENSDMTFVQRAIVQEAHDRLLPFLESFEKFKEPSVNIESLAKATLGLQTSEVIDFIKADLEYKGHKNFSRQNLSDIYLQVQNYQMKALDFSRPSSSTSSFFS